MDLLGGRGGAGAAGDRRAIIPHCVKTANLPVAILGRAGRVGSPFVAREGRPETCVAPGGRLPPGGLGGDGALPRA